MADKVFIQYRFTIENYSDALIMSEDEYKLLKKADIEKLKKERFDNWKKMVAEASTQEPVEPTKEELEEQLAELDRQREEVLRLLEP